MTDLSQWAQPGLRMRRGRKPLQFQKLPIHHATRFLGLVVPLLLLAAWYVSTTARWVPEQILPAPATVIAAFATLIDNGDLQSNLWISLTRVAGGFGAGALVGLVFGAGMGFSDRFARLVRPT